MKQKTSKYKEVTMSQNLKFFLAVLIMLLLTNLSEALLIELPLPELVKESDIIIRGEVVKTESRWGYLEYNANSRIIFTDVTIAVTDYLKGASDKSEVVIETEGGEIGEIGLMVEDMPKFETGEDVVLFLSQENNQGMRKVANLRNGKYSISEGTVLERDEPITRFERTIKQFVKDQKEEK